MSQRDRPQDPFRQDFPMKADERIKVSGHALVFVVLKPKI